MRPLKTTAAAVILAITAVTVPSAWEQHRCASCVPAAGSTPWSKTGRMEVLRIRLKPVCRAPVRVNRRLPVTHHRVITWSA